MKDCSQSHLSENPSVELNRQICFIPCDMYKWANTKDHRWISNSSMGTLGISSVAASKMHLNVMVRNKIITLSSTTVCLGQKQHNYVIKQGCLGQKQHNYAIKHGCLGQKQHNYVIKHVYFGQKQYNYVIKHGCLGQKQYNYVMKQGFLGQKQHNYVIKHGCLGQKQHNYVIKHDCLSWSETT